MAINVDTVYKTVLLILNKEQRGYMTPDEFNKTATQVQLDIFEQYFDDMNQQLRIPQSDYDYSNRQTDIDDKIAIFKEEGWCYFTLQENGIFSLPQTTIGGVPVIYDGSTPPVNHYNFYKLGTVTYHREDGEVVRLQRLQKSEFYEINKSDLTAPSENFPVYLYEGSDGSGRNIIRVSPGSMYAGIKASFIRKPKDVVWGYSVGSLGQYIYNASASVSTQIELHPSEQVDVILKILLYSGIIVRDPQIVQAAASEIKQNEINQKS